MPTPNPAEIETAISVMLRGDTALMTLATDGVWFKVAAQGAENFVVFDRILAENVPMYGGLAYMDALYLIKFVGKSASGVNAVAAAERIRVLFEDKPLTVSLGSPSDVPGWTNMACFCESPIRDVEIDGVDPSIRWQHAGGNYRITMAPA